MLFDFPFHLLDFLLLRSGKFFTSVTPSAFRCASRHCSSREVPGPHSLAEMADKSKCQAGVWKGTAEGKVPVIFVRIDVTLSMTHGFGIAVIVH